jgi:hypothetical protein
MQLDKFTRHLPQKDILLLDFEELQKNPTLIQSRIYDFLGVERSFRRTAIHNSRDIEFRLNSQQRAEVAEAVRPDVQRLIRKYGFTPAEQWLRQTT